MKVQTFPGLDARGIAATRDALHAYSQVLGGWLKALRMPRKHWWHASLRPSLRGLTTGAVRAGADFEIELDLVASQLRVRTSISDFTEDLTGQSAARVASWLDEVLGSIGVDPALAPGDGVRGTNSHVDYSARQAQRMQGAVASVAGALEDFRAGIREETSPIQFWPHHFDLAMIWLPGHKVPGEDPADEELADKQMNFGFVFGDEGIDEPYFYVTAYPLTQAMRNVELPSGTTWQSAGFSGAVLYYSELVEMGDPAANLHQLWTTMLAAGRIHVATDE